MFLPVVQRVHLTFDLLLGVHFQTLLLSLPEESQMVVTEMAGTMQIAPGLLRIVTAPLVVMGQAVAWVFVFLADLF